MPPPIPSSSLSIQDGASGIAADDTSADSWKIGASSLGVAGTIYSFRGTKTQSVRTSIGYGPGPDAVIDHLIESGGKTVHFVKGAAGNAGANSSVTASGGGPAVTLTGTPNNDFEGIVKVTLGGIVGTSRFKFSLDGGDTYSDEIVTASTYLMPNTGVTLNFAAGTYVLDETYSFTCTGPSNTSANIAAALDIIIASPLVGGFVHVVGNAATAADTDTIVVAVGAKMSTAEAAKKFMFAIVESPPVAASGLITEYADLVQLRVCVAGGFLEHVANDNSGRVSKRSFGRTLAARIAKVPISVDPSRDATDSNLEALPNVKTLVPFGSAASTGYHDEGVTPGLNAARVSVAMSHVGLEGYYVCNALILAGAGSDFQRVTYRRIMDRACAVTYQATLRYLAKKILVDRTTGFILESQAQAIESDIGAKLRAALVAKGHASEVTVVVNRADNLLADSTLRVKIRITGPSYSTVLETEIGFYNPAAVLAAA